MLPALRHRASGHRHLLTGSAALVLTRQAVPVIDRTRYAPASGLERGAYVLADAPGGKPDVLLLDIDHRFAYEYDAYISESFMELRVQPKTTADQTVSSFVLSVGPPTRVNRDLDWNDNVTHHFTITRFHDRIEVSSRSLVSTHSFRSG